MVPLVVPTTRCSCSTTGSALELWFDAMLYIRDRKLYPLQLILRELIIQNTSSMEMSLSTSATTTLHLRNHQIFHHRRSHGAHPSAYPFLQKYFVKASGRRGEG
jgi:putative aldouronate transport system permease protein